MLTPQSTVLTLCGLSPTGDLGPLTGYTSKRGRAVWFLKSPPKTPPTGWQRQQRNRFKMIALLWAQLLTTQRVDWERASLGAKLNITGYNLFVWHQQTHDDQVIHTVERQSGIQLLPLFEP